MSGDDDDDSRVHVGFATITGQKSLQVTLPKQVALGQGFHIGDVCEIFYDAKRDEFVVAKPSSNLEEVSARGQ